MSTTKLATPYCPCCDSQQIILNREKFHHYEFLIRVTNSAGRTEDLVLTLTPKSMNRLMVLLEDYKR